MWTVVFGVISFLSAVAILIVGGMDLAYYWVAVPVVTNSLLYMLIDDSRLLESRGVLSQIAGALFSNCLAMTGFYWLGWLAGYFFR